MNKKKLVTTLGSLALVGAIGVGATLAYFSDKTGQINNTFTLSDKVKVVLDEQKYGDENANRVLANHYDNVVQGVNYDKDPTVTLGNTDLKQYAFIALDESKDMEIVDLQNQNWQHIETVDNIKVYVYVNNGDYIVTANNDVKTEEQEQAGDYEAGIQLTPLFTQVKLKDTVSAEENKKELDGIKLAAAAIQAEGIENDGETPAYMVAYNAIKTGLLQAVNG